MIKILKQQTENSYPVYYCETSADLQKLSTFAPVGSIAYENGKQYILNSLREFAVLEYSTNLDDIQLPPDVKEYWESSSLGNILETIYNNIQELYKRTNNQILIETVGNINNNSQDNIIISGMSKAAFKSKVNAGEFVDIKVVSRIPSSDGGYQYVRPQVLSTLVASSGTSCVMTVKYSDGGLSTIDLFTTEGWVEDSPL